MPGALIIAVEGVLRSPTGQPIKEGMTLYNVLSPVVRTILVLDELEPDVAQHWLKVEGMKTHLELVAADERFIGTELRQWQLERAQARMPVETLIDSSPSNVAAAMALGISGLLFGQPRYQRAEFRPDASRDIKPWSQIQEEVERQRVLLAKERQPGGLLEPPVLVEND